MTCPHPGFCKAVAHTYQQKSNWNSLHACNTMGVQKPVIMWPPGPLVVGCTFSDIEPTLISFEPKPVHVEGVTVKKLNDKNKTDIAWAILGCVGLLVVVLALLSRHG